MTWQFTPFLLLILLAVITTAVLSIYTWRHRRAHAAPALLAITLLACFWSFTYMLEMAAPDLETKLTFIKIEYIAIVLLPVAWLLFAMRFTDHNSWITPRFRLALLIIPLFSLMLIWSEPRHGLYYDSVGLRTIEGISYFSPEYGTWFWIHSFYSYTLYVIGVVLIYQRMRESVGLYRQQAEIVLLGSMPPFVTSFIFVLAPTTLDPAPIAFSITSVFFAWGLFRMQLLDLRSDLKLDNLKSERQTGISDVIYDSRVRILNIVLWGFSFLTLIQLAPMVITELQRPRPDYTVVAVAIGFYLLFVVLAAAYRMPYRIRGGLLLGVLYLFAFNNLRQIGLDIDSGMILFAFVVFAYILFGRFAGIVAMIVSLITLGLSGWQIVTGEIQVQSVYVEGAPWTILLVPLLSFALFAGAILLSQASLLSDMQTLLTRSEGLSRELEQERQLLEQRVNERTRALSISASISRKLSTILEPELLVEEVVNQLREAFDYYHSHIYLLDEETQILKMVGGTGDPGRLMAERGHTLDVGEGMVGRTAATGAPILARDVTQEASFRPNPLLPDTRSELSVPIRYGEQVLGVLDVQQSVPDGFGPQDLDVLQSVANQLAVALRNSRLYTDARRRAEREMLANQISQRILQTVDVESALKVAIRELGEALDASDTRVALRVEEESTSAEIPPLSDTPSLDVETVRRHGS